MFNFLSHKKWMIWKIYSWEDPKFGSTEVQIKLSRESGKKGSFSSWDFREETQCENLPAVTSGCHFCRAVSLLFGLNAVLSSPACMQDLSIFRICLFVNISWVNLPAFVPSNRHEWTPRRFWFTNPDGTAFSEAAPPSAFYPWLRGFYSSRSAPLRVNLSNLTSGRSGEEPRFSEVGGIVQKLHTVGSDCEWEGNSGNCHEERRCLEAVVCICVSAKVAFVWHDMAPNTPSDPATLFRGSAISRKSVTLLTLNFSTLIHKVPPCNELFMFAFKRFSQFCNESSTTHETISI